jgi:molybdopterin converting factor small subunit
MPHACRVELLGPARLVAGVKECAVELEGEVTVRALLPLLAARCPALVGPVLDLERGTLVDGYVLNRNGRDFLADLDATIAPGDSLLLLASSAGG